MARVTPQERIAAQYAAAARGDARTLLSTVLSAADGNHIRAHSTGHATVGV